MIRHFCCCCGKRALPGPIAADNPAFTTLDGAKAGFRVDEVFCGYCAQDLDEDGLFPEERAAVESLRTPTKCPPS